MLKFFRRIQRKLLNEENLKKYLIYVFGEIFLVVIGILIALQVNNWNEKRKNKQEVEILINLLEKELVENIRIDSRNIDFGYRKDSLINLVLSEKVTRQMYYEDGELRNLILNFFPGGPNYEALEKILIREENFPKYLEILLPMLKEYKKRIDEYNTGQGPIITNLVEDNYLYLINNYPWFSRNDSVALVTKTEYFLKDPIYRNRVAFYESVVLQNGIRRRLELRSLALGLLVQLKIKREAYQVGDIRELLENHGLSPFEIISCETDYTRWERVGNLPYFPLLLINQKNDPVVLFQLNDKGR